MESNEGILSGVDIDPFQDILDQHPGATLMNVTGNPYAAINARGLQMDANALAAAGLNSFTSSATPATTGGGKITLQDILNLPLTEEAKLRRAEEAYAKAVLDLRNYNKGRKYDTADKWTEEGDEQDSDFFVGSEYDKQGGQKGRQNAVQVTKAALEGLGGSPYGSLLKRGIVTVAQLATTGMNRAMNTVGGPNFRQVTLNPLQGSVTGQYTDSGQYTPLKIGETKDGTIVAASTGIPALDALIGGSTTTDADGSISGIKKPDFGTIWENIGGVTGAAGTLSLLGEDASETFDPTTVTPAIDANATTPDTVFTYGGLSPQEIAYNKAMKVFDGAGGGEEGKAAVLQALEDNGLTIADLSEQTGVSIAELETFLTPAATGADIVTTGTGTDIVVETPQQIAYKKAIKVFDDAGGGEAGKAAVLQALEDNGLTIADLSEQTGVSLDEIKTFLTPVVDNTTTSTVSDLDKINTIFSTGTGLQGESATGVLGLDTAGPLNLTKRVAIADPLDDILKRVDYSPLDLTAGIQVDVKPDDLTKRVAIADPLDDITKRVDYSPLDLKKSIDALDQKLELKKGIGALDQQPNVLRSVTLTGEPSIGGGISELRSGPSFGGAVTLETGPNASGTLEHVPGASTTYRSSLGEDFPGAAATLRASLNEGAPGDLKGTLRAGSLEGTLTAGEVFKGEIKGSTSPAEKTSTLRGSSGGGGGGGGGGGMDTGGGGPGQVAGGPGGLAEIEYLFQRFGDTIFAPELTKEEENELLYPYS